MSRIGIISDTHGPLRPQALYALAGCMRILHGGDIGGAGPRRFRLPVSLTMLEIEGTRVAARIVELVQPQAAAVRRMMPTSTAAPAT